MAVTLSLAGNEPQRRWTVAIRVVLLVPHLLFTAVLQTAALVVVFIAWFAVLFTGQLPRGMGDFLRRVLQYQTRAYAYGFLLTDRFPPFDVGPAGYPVELHVDEPGTFNRAAVLFRLVLQLPALLLSQIATAGATVVLFFVWLVTLISARVPPSAFIALATILRYQMRTWAYVGLLTTDYPGGLLGDRDEALLGPTTDELPESPRVDRFVLSGGAKVIVWLALLLGLGVGGINVAVTIAGVGSTRELLDMDRDLQAAYDTWDDESRDCSRGGDSSCQRLANNDLRAELQRYGSRLFELEVPESAVDEGMEVFEEIEEMLGLLGEMTELSDEQEQLRLYFLIEDAKLRYDEAFDDLFDAVSYG